jgi:hypothetical protein
MPLKMNHETLKVTIEEISVEFLDEPYVVHTFRGFAPVVDVQVGKEKKSLFIAPSSLATGLMPLVERKGSFKGIKIKLKKDSTDRFAKYVVTPVD